MRLPDDRGFATVLSVWLMLVLMIAAAATVVVAQVILVRQSARTAADLAALSAASRLLAGGSLDEACAAATRSAGASGAELVSCQIDGLDAVVAVRRELPAIVMPMLGGEGVHGWPDRYLNVTARAGPSTA